MENNLLQYGEPPTCEEDLAESETIFFTSDNDTIYSSL